MEYTTQDLVMAAIKGDAVGSAEAFNNLITDRIASSIQDRKLELAQSIFNSNQQPEEDEYEEDEEYDEDEDLEADEEDEEEEDENA